MPSHKILVGSYTDNISTLVFTEAADGSGPKLKFKSTVSVGHHPSWVTLYPAASTPEKTVVFTGVEQYEGLIAALEFDAEGRGKLISHTTAGGRDPCTMVVTKDGKELIVGNVRVRCLD
jgi:6-phosphogluconolactonase (cycloisomerase 2 family)